MVTTLKSLRESDFDGLNNLLQMPFALPWFLLPVATSDHEANAWVTAGMGMLNAALIYVCVYLVVRAAARNRH